MMKGVNVHNGTIWDYANSKGTTIHEKAVRDNTNLRKGATIHNEVIQDYTNLRTATIQGEDVSDYANSRDDIIHDRVI
ncbi:hypothetical protein GOBAR_AA08850 [Gossypium barbadense]|uniref:Uncharacterized protein n=1 Tax=Gossypium barbadense TaxID=3634 RepID=A0A2P5Y887_GOSBA|nr:hypothetical protein GOBAR_AA08850 [Gossypium barbadense]